MAVYAHKGERKEPKYGIEGSSTKTNYSYAKPGVKPQYGKTPLLGYDIENYKLPDIDVDTERRNFPGYTQSQPYSLDEIRQGDISGTTETDSKTDPAGSAGYTRINNRSKAPTPGTRR
jgi:hypothetical protein